MRTARIIIFAIAAALAAFALYTLLTPPEAGALPAWNRPVAGYEIINLFLAAASLAVAGALVRVGLHKTRERLVRGLRRFAAIFISIVALVAVLDVVLASFPRLQTSFVDPTLLWPNGDPSMMEDSDLGYKGRPNYEGRALWDPEKQGGLVGLIDPARRLPTGEQPFYIELQYDKNGFLAPEPLQADFLIVGDSVGFGVGVPLEKNWARMFGVKLYTQHKTITYNISMPDYCPAQEYTALAKFGFDKKPRVVLWVFYEGNDVTDVGVFEDFKKLQREKGLNWSDYVVHRRARDGAADLPPQRFPYNRPAARLLLHLAKLINPVAPVYDEFSPVTLEAGGNKKPNALHPGDFYQMSMARDQMKQWSDWQGAQKFLNRAMDDCLPRGIKFVLIYFPTKGHVYLPLIDEQVDHEALYKFASGAMPEDFKKGAEDLFRRLRQNNSNLANLLRQMCLDRANRAAIFIDTTEALQKAALSGDFPFLCYDTHLNEKGNDVVCDFIMNRLQAEGLIPASP